MTKAPCGNAECVRYEMTQMEFRRLRGELWDQSFISSFGKRAVKLHKDIYGKKPRVRRSRTAKRNHVSLFPCGILEQVYRQMMQEGVPLVKPNSWVDRQLARGYRITPRIDNEITIGNREHRRKSAPETFVPVRKIMP